MRSTAVMGGLICTLAACGGGSSSSNADPVTAGATTVAVSNAFISALAGINTPAQPGTHSGLLLSAGESQAVRQGLTNIARNAAAGQAQCSDTCGGSTGTKTIHCSLPTTSVSCSAGGAASVGGTLDFTVNCQTDAFSANVGFDLGFSNCSSEGVTLNAPSPMRLAGQVSSQGSSASVNLTLKVNGLQVKGNVCSRSIDQTCNIDLAVAGNESDVSVSGQICGCDARKLAASQNVCSASC
jgi:hypothetical protein